jgi:ubiquinone/menaquinone biosynthesis C-methylase UbiE
VFGYIHKKSLVQDLFLRVIGYTNYLRRIQAKTLISLLDAQKEDIVLDIGCGPGAFNFELSKLSRTSIGLDLMLNPCSSYIADRPSNIQYISADAQNLSIVSGSIDKILLSSVLQIVPNDLALIIECNRVLKGGGTIVLSVPTKYLFIHRLNAMKPELNERFKVYGKGYYDKNELIKSLTKNGFIITEAKYCPSVLGSLVFEIGIYLWVRYSFTFFSFPTFLLIYPTIFFDKLLKPSIGNELILKIEKK